MNVTVPPHRHPVAPRPSARPPVARPTTAFVAALLAGILAGCATRPPRFPEPLRAPKQEAPQAEVLTQDQGAGGRTRPRIEEGPKIERPATAQPQQAAAAEIPPIPAKKPVSLVLDGVPLPTFINVVFGTELGFAIEIDQAVRNRTDLVSLRLTEPTPPERLYAIAVEVLRNYGVQVRELGGVLRFFPPPTTAGMPQVVVARSTAEVPYSQRPVFVAMPLDAAVPGQIAGVLRNIFGAQSNVTLTELPEQNALLISGPPDAVQATMEAVDALDRAALGDKRSLRINPLYLPAEVLAKELREVVAAQGYSVRLGPGTSGVLTFVPVASANALILFSESDEALRVAAEWAERLDQPSDASAGDGGVYLYAARHTTVETLVPVLEALIGGTVPGGGVGRGGAGSAPSPGGEMAAPPPQAQGASPRNVSVISGQGAQLAVDPVRNVIVFQGDAQRWRAIQGVLARLDQPARQVVIEVTVAEVTLTDEFEHGIEWALRNINFAGMSGPVTALRGGEPNSGGLVWRALSGSGQVSALVNLFARDSRVTILSTPRLLVKSGEQASIDVGTEVPVITQQATAPDLPRNQPSILQSIQYRKTGVLLNIQAVVHSGQRVDLKLTQEVSEATTTDTSEIPSPSIFSRRLTTSLSLADGESMLLGGLISSSRSDGKTKVPLLGDVPLVGRLFQNRRKSGTRTEMLMLITPYVVEDAGQARAITDAIRERFGSETSPRWLRPRPQPAPAAPPAPAPAPAVPPADERTQPADGRAAPSSPPAPATPAAQGRQP
ncbi:secretin N-terminal domain-containing protein [Vulcaniibacterium gelatinicum]|uniref:secretin N-terminal domain-containing protein n=1 Tax=Vulcaniibacterium gelatinicum TaxID=2598725 RepID=UPI0011C8BC10|nr:secretin N-terminal domain-containing protein [Vulcaniibacterium gelatinicum]